MNKTVSIKKYRMDKAGNILAIPAPRKRRKAKGRRAPKVIRFLLGEGELDGAWYGDYPPGFPRHWWRLDLRKWLGKNGFTLPAPKGNK